MRQRARALMTTGRVLRHSLICPSRVCFGEASPAAGAPAFETPSEGSGRRGLRKAEDRPVGQWCPMSIVSVGNPTCRVTEDLDRRLWHVLVIVCRTRLSEVIEYPRKLFPRVDAPLRGNACQFADLAKPIVWPASTAEEHRVIRGRVLGAQALQVQPDRAVHRPPERLASLDASVVQPNPTRIAL